MKNWVGSAGVCVNAQGELLMVLQGKPEEEKKWSVPSGGQERGETLKECCKREVYEETGYEAEIIDKLFVKHIELDGYNIEVHYFSIRIVGGKAVIQDPDQLIHEIAWVAKDALKEIELAFPEDQDFLLHQMENVDLLKK
ncbi:NUDIX hydrolase [Heyndrickxia oleronia]|jgi:ADP-ribose pyrophosphatase YjhB (NUDIX family)|uniref:NUDIX hydrolase n=1 Tax=Heyndrickxia oleronia TaxID=38875 RepID=UPI0037524BAE